MASTTHDVTAPIVGAAMAFLATLSVAETETVSFAWTDTAQKQRWSNFPTGAFVRTGLRWGQLGETQQRAWLALMRATLSSAGYARVMAAWNACDVEAARHTTTPIGRPRASFGKESFYVALIGTPSATAPWQWQWGGHHVTLNATIVGPNLSLTPSFIGVQPGAYPDATGTMVRPLGDIEDEAFALINALDVTQQHAAVRSAGPIDLVLGPGRDGKTIPAEGLPASQMTADQQAALLRLIGYYTGLANDATAAARLAEVRSTLNQTYLAWYGPTARGTAAYWRVHGPVVVIEYAPQGNPVDPEHVHGIYRDPTNDYGAKHAPWPARAAASVAGGA